MKINKNLVGTVVKFIGKKSRKTITGLFHSFDKKYFWVARINGLEKTKCATLDKLSRNEWEISE